MSVTPRENPSSPQFIISAVCPPAQRQEGGLPSGRMTSASSWPLRSPSCRLSSPCSAMPLRVDSWPFFCRSCGKIKPCQCNHTLPDQVRSNAFASEYKLLQGEIQSNGGPTAIQQIGATICTNVCTSHSFIPSLTHHSFIHSTQKACSPFQVKGEPAISWSAVSPMALRSHTATECRFLKHGFDFLVCL